MMEQLLLTVVMSCFNDERTVRRSVGSLQSQTLQNWKLIVIDDGSQDSTPFILNELAKQDQRIEILTQANTGLTRALIAGCDRVTTEFIARQDADDVSLPDRLDRQLAFLTAHQDVGFVSCWAEAVGPEGEFLELCRRTEDSQAATEDILQFRLGPPAHGSVMFRTDLYRQAGGYRPEFYYGQDSDLWARFVEHSCLGYLPEVLYQFVRSPSGISGNRRHIQRQFGVLEHACAIARRTGLSEDQPFSEAAKLAASARSGVQLNPAAEAKMNYLIGSQLVQNRDPRARRYLKNVLTASPLHWKAWIRLCQSLLSSKRRKESDQESHS